ncbi:hypothetical protein ABMA28_005544 [Loxostege sticticalis]|uniref:THAP-type domain-containing protein n=1 Tax=Loxostege sticticalis TaxID=481309 RepID=A0ABD0SM00_LOXSC
MPSCVIKDCSNHSRKTKKSEGVTFHRFLRVGHEKRELWIQFVQRNRNEETWLPNQHTYICSLHFKDQDKYNTKSGRVYLKKCAIPYDYKNPPLPGPSKPEQSKLLSDPISEPVSESESIFDSPRKILLKKKLLNETTARKNLTKKIKKLQTP